VSTFITRYDTEGTGLRLAVKDLIDLEGEVTTAGSRAVADRAQPAPTDAACLAGARAAGVRIVGKTNLHELALGVTGINDWYGTPVNPLDPARVPGGSSSGSAVAVAVGEADVAYGSDTGGSIRIPAACTGTAGLKTTYGRIPLGGVWPLSPSFDTVGPMARDVSGLVSGMELLEPGFTVAPLTDLRVARLRLPVDPRIDAALDGALAHAEWVPDDLVLPEWDQATADGGLLLVAEAWATNRDLVASDPAGIGPSVRQRLESGAAFTAEQVAGAWSGQVSWRRSLVEVFTRYDLVVGPTLSVFPPTLPDADALLAGRCTLPINLAGVPALALPVPAEGGFPASVQLIGPHHSEEQLISAGAWLEAAIWASS
jgi:amidase